ALGVVPAQPKSTRMIGVAPAPAYGSIELRRDAFGSVPLASEDQVAPVDIASNAPPPSLNAAMARHIERALQQTGGRIEGPNGAAKLLNINPHTLRARMRKLGIDW